MILRKNLPQRKRSLKTRICRRKNPDRHANFVKHYEDNLKELRANLDDVELAKTKSDRKAKIEKALLHLDKVKPPKKHIPLDPNRLPNRMVKAKARAPRLKKEDFEKDFPQQKSKGTKTALATDPDPLCSLIAKIKYDESQNKPQAAIKRKPILLAFNGSMRDMPSSVKHSYRPSSSPSDLSSKYLCPSYRFFFAVDTRSGSTYTTHC